MRDFITLRSIADWQLRPRLLGVPDVAQANVPGGEQEQIQIPLNPHELQKRLITPAALAEMLRLISTTTDGGFSADDQKEWLIRKRGDASVNGQSAVIIMVQKQNNADTLAVTKEVDRALAEFKKTLPAGVDLHPALFKQSDFIEAAISNVVEAIRDGTIIVCLILFLFLLNVQTTLVTLTAIPLFLLLTAILFHAFGIGINTMSLRGLAVAVGELVDGQGAGREIHPCIRS